MSSEHPFRTPSCLASVELCCPHCERTLYIAPPEALVSLTTCPHPNCQHVALVCGGEALGRDRLGWEAADQAVAMTLEHFLAARGRVVSLSVGEVLCTFGPFFAIFLVIPFAMCAYAWDAGVKLLMQVAMCTSPAILLGVGMIAVIFVCERDDRRERRQLAAVRRRAFARARWQLARVRLEPNPAATPTATRDR